MSGGGAIIPLPEKTHVRPSTVSPSCIFLSIVPILFSVPILATGAGAAAGAFGTTRLFFLAFTAIGDSAPFILAVLPMLEVDPGLSNSACAAWAAAAAALAAAGSSPSSSQTCTPVNFVSSTMSENIVSRVRGWPNSSNGSSPGDAAVSSSVWERTPPSASNSVKSNACGPDFLLPGPPLDPGTVGVRCPGPLLKRNGVDTLGVEPVPLMKSFELSINGVSSPVGGGVSRPP
mmetsp:Transcript_22182/g.51527  ORF Transcript_22182/g.51527 Transcript_22182/m.51527 type:complete len:232 (+) Transcript_22182:1205-1900(+)